MGLIGDLATVSQGLLCVLLRADRFVKPDTRETMSPTAVMIPIVNK
jgi:hypothetical protein